MPLGAFGMARSCSTTAARAAAMPAPATGLGIAAFLRPARDVADRARPGRHRPVLRQFVVPLFALIQSRTPKTRRRPRDRRAQHQNSGFVVAASMISPGKREWAHWSIPQIFLALAIANAGRDLDLPPHRPRILVMRFLSWLLVRSLYRLRVGHGRDPGRGRGADRVQPRQLHGRAGAERVDPAASALRHVLPDLRIR